MQIRKIITGVLIASTLSLSAPAIAVASGEDEGGIVPAHLGEGGNIYLYMLGVIVLTGAVFALTDHSRSP